ncbi:hypothetical protein [Oceanotoga teriensis]|uniref:hypothetical protein n=1 Tax=Oceanotoga teriensis TaxID=515440 RepID=UPI0027127C9D|nr:hypothetical protein [Oceanotoga teriensis]MDO7976736.1 hypothetical protein [Oceanotoga teriensis]
MKHDDIWEHLEKTRQEEKNYSLFNKNETIDNTLMPDVLNFFSPNDKKIFPFQTNVPLINSNKTTISGTIFKNEIGNNEKGEKYQILIYSSQDNMKFTKFDLLVDTATRVLWNQHIYNNGDPKTLITNIEEYMELLKETNKNKSQLKKMIIESLMKFSNINFKIINYPLHETTDEKSLYFNMSYFDVNIMESGTIKIFFNEEYIKNIYKSQKIFNYDINELKKISSSTGKFLYRIIKQFEDDTNILTFDIFDLARNLLIDIEKTDGKMKKGYELKKRSFSKPLNELKKLSIIDDYKYKKDKITIILSDNRVIEKNKFYFYIHTYNELRELLVKEGNMIPSFFEQIFNDYGHKKFSINYELARANVLSNKGIIDDKTYMEKVKNGNINEEISKIITYFYKRNEEMKIQKSFSITLRYHSLGFKALSDERDKKFKNKKEA